MVDRRTEILNGELSFPVQIMEIINPDNNQEVKILVEEFWLNLTHNFFREKSCDSVTWLCKFDNAKGYCPTNCR